MEDSTATKTQNSKEFELQSFEAKDEISSSSSSRNEKKESGEEKVNELDSPKSSPTGENFSVPVGKMFYCSYQQLMKLLDE